MRDLEMKAGWGGSWRLLGKCECFDQLRVPQWNIVLAKIFFGVFVCCLMERSICCFWPTQYYSLGAFNNRITVLEASKFRIRVQPDSWLLISELSFLATILPHGHMTSSLDTHSRGERMCKFLMPLLIRALIPLWGPHPCDLFQS